VPSDSDDPQARAEHAPWTAGSDGVADPLSMFVTRNDGQVVVHLRGELDMATAPALATCLERLGQADSDTVVVDASHLDFCDSSGLDVLVRYNRDAQQDGARLVLRSPSDGVRRLLEVTHLEHLVEDAQREPGDTGAWARRRAGRPRAGQDATEHQ
jgi:anti-anti-sigma factor